MKERATDTPVGDSDEYPYERRVLAAAPERTGDAFYHASRDVVATLISAAFVAVFVGYLSMLVAWAAWEWWGA